MDHSDNLKIAVLVSGAFRTGHPRGDLVKNNIRQREKFPNADFYYATWHRFEDDFKRLLPAEKCEYFEEPKILYHPYLDIPRHLHCSPYYQETVDWVKAGGKERIEWTSHHTKQHLIHAYLVQSLKEKYDIIVRTRFDGYIWHKANFTPFLDDSYLKSRANGFAVTRHEKFAEYYSGDITPNTKMRNWMLDQLIIYKNGMYSPDDTLTMHETGLLHAAEYGWYQLLSKPFNDNHSNNHGWVNHDRNVPERFLIQ